MRVHTFMLSFSLLASLLIIPAQAEENVYNGNPQNEEILTGDTKLACEATLCLSSGTRPGECGPSLSRYFGISKKKWKDTVKARRNFLNQCPVSSKPGMPSLVESIVNGAGRCNASLLNSVLARRVTVRVCRENYRYWEEDACHNDIITVIDNALPSYCKSYSGHQYTYGVGVRYVGDKMKGGRWVDE